MGSPLRWVVGMVAAVVVTAVVTWVVASQALRSPAEVAADAEAPDPGPVTVAVEERVLEAEVIVRGTVQFDEPVGVGLAGQPAVDGQAVATRLPQPDEQVDEGDVLLEVSGRPVFALEGELPAYRDLRPGVSGDDVAQLQTALRRLGHLDGDDDGEFGPATRSALEALYEDAGHEAPGPSAEDREQLRAADDEVSAAREQLRQAERQLEEAQRGPGEVELLEAEHQVEQARERVDATPAGGTERRQAVRELALAEARLDDLRTPPDTGGEEQAVADARGSLEDAQARSGELEATTGTWLPAGEMVYLPELPQRVHEVEVGLGDEVGGELLTISSPTVVVDTSIPEADVALVAEGDEVVIDLDDGGELGGVIVELADAPGTGDVGDDRHHARIEPDEDADELLDASLRIRVPVESTDGEVLAVPLAAVSAAADGTSRVEVVSGEADDNPPATRLVTVEPGLSTDGVVEVRPIDDRLVAGDLVVVGADDATDDDGPDDATDDDGEDDDPDGEDAA